MPALARLQCGTGCWSTGEAGAGRDGDAGVRVPVLVHRVPEACALGLCMLVFSSLAACNVPPLLLCTCCALAQLAAQTSFVWYVSNGLIVGSSAWLM